MQARYEVGWGGRVVVGDGVSETPAEYSGIPVNIIVTPWNRYQAGSILELAPHGHASFFSVHGHGKKTHFNPPFRREISLNIF
jgi:hypothetical protein